MPEAKEFILKNGDHITIKDETARSNIETLSNSIGNVVASTEGTNITITDAANGYLQGVTIKGHSEIVEGEIKSIGNSGRGIVDLGTLDYTYVSNSATPRFMTPLSVIKCKSNIYDITSDLYTPLETFWTTADNDLKIASGGSYLNISNFAYTDPEAFKAAMSGVFISYPVIDETPLVSITSKDSTGHGTSAIITTGLPLQSTTDGSVYDELDSTTGSVITRCEVVNNEVVAKATPVVTLLTETEKSALAALPTFTNTTIITTTDTPVLSVKYFKNNDSGKTVSRIDTDVKSLSKTKMDKPDTNGTAGQALITANNGNIVWGIPSSYDNHDFNENLPFNDLTEVFADEIAQRNNNPWNWIRYRARSNNLAGIHLGDYIKFSFAIGEGPLLEYTARIHRIYRNYANTYYNIDFWCDELLPNKIKWNDKIPAAQAQYYFNEGLDGQTGFYMPFQCSTPYHYLNALNGYVCNSATWNSSNSTTTFTFTQEDFTQTGIWNYIPQDLKTYIVAKGGFGSSKQSLTTGTALTHNTNQSTSYKYIYPAIVSTNLGYLWLPNSYDFFLSTQFNYTNNILTSAISNNYASIAHGGNTQAVACNNGQNTFPMIFLQHMITLNWLTKHHPECGLLYDRNNPNSNNTEFWLGDVSDFQYLYAYNPRKQSNYGTINRNALCTDEKYLPLCFTI